MELFFWVLGKETVLLQQASQHTEVHILNKKKKTHHTLFSNDQFLLQYILKKKKKITGFVNLILFAVCPVSIKCIQHFYISHSVLLVQNIQ